MRRTLIALAVVFATLFGAACSAQGGAGTTATIPVFTTAGHTSGRHLAASQGKW